MDVFSSTPVVRAWGRYRKQRKVPLRTRFVVGCLLSVAAQTPSSAGLLNLELLDSPDIFSAFLDVSYDASDQQFSAVGFAFTIDDGLGPQININNGSFELLASVTNAGLATDGTLALGGEVLGFGSFNPLLTGELVDFGWRDGGGDLFEFLFTVTGGDLATTEYYGEPGAVLGVILTAEFGSGGFTGSFSEDFANGGTGLSNTAPIPEPATIWLGVISLGAVAGFKRPRA